MTRFVLGDETQASQTIYALIEESLDKMNDGDFAKLYNTFYANHGGGPFQKHAFGEKTTKTISVVQGKSKAPTREVVEFTTPLPRAQQRLLHLLQQEPQLFSEPLVTVWKKWNDKKEK